MILSRTSQYAVQALIYMATQPMGTPILNKDIAAQLNVPAPYLAKILQSLAKGQRLADFPEPPGPARVDKGDFQGAVGVFLLVFLSTFPVVIPFALLKDISLALRLSNAVAVAMLFLTGYAFGRITGRRPSAVWIFMMLLGALLVGLTMALGG